MCKVGSYQNDRIGKHTKKHGQKNRRVPSIPAHSLAIIPGLLAVGHAADAVERRRIQINLTCKSRSSPHSAEYCQVKTLWGRPLQVHVPEQQKEGKMGTSSFICSCQRGAGVETTVRQGEDVGSPALQVRGITSSSPLASPSQGSQTQGAAHLAARRPRKRLVFASAQCLEALSLCSQTVLFDY